MELYSQQKKECQTRLVGWPEMEANVNLFGKIFWCKPWIISYLHPFEECCVRKACQSLNGISAWNYWIVWFKLYCSLAMIMYLSGIFDSDYSRQKPSSSQIFFLKFLPSSMQCCISNWRKQIMFSGLWWTNSFMNKHCSN